MHTKNPVLNGLLIAFFYLAVTTFAVAQQPLPMEGDESTLIQVLESDAPLFDKAKACQRLAVIGTKDAVPSLARYLSDEKMSHYARTGLEPNPDPSADAVLRAALNDLQGGLLVGVINSIGMRRDAKAVDPLIPLLGSDDHAVASATAQTLGQIGTPRATELLLGALDSETSQRIAVADGCLTAADALLKNGQHEEAAALFDAIRKARLPRHVVFAALGGAIRARGKDGLVLLVEQLQSEDEDLFALGLSMAHQLPGSGVTDALLAAFKATVSSPDDATTELQILRAEYGTEDIWIDVTDEVIAAAQGDGLAIQAGNQIAGDPNGGESKTLRVSYSLGDELKTAVVAEGEWLKLEGTLTRHPRQASVISVLGERGDKAALPVVLDAAKNGAWDVRLPAIRALAQLGDASAVPVMLETAAVGGRGLAAAALDSLTALPGEQVDATLKDMLAGTTGRKKLAVIELIGRRTITSSIPDLFKLIGDADQPTRAAAITALGLTVGLDDLPKLVQQLAEPSSADVLVAVKEALRRACLRMPDRSACTTILIEAMKAVPPSAQTDLLDLLGVVGGPDALAFVAGQAKDGSESMQDAATRVLGEWMSPDAATVLLDLAKSGNPKFQVRTLRGYLRIAKQLDVPTDERIRMCRQALDIATRQQERQLVLDTLELYPTGGSLAIVTRLATDPDLKESACEVALAMAQKMIRSQPAVVVEAMSQVMKVTGDKTKSENARKMLNRANRQKR